MAYRVHMLCFVFVDYGSHAVRIVQSWPLIWNLESRLLCYLIFGYACCFYFHFMTYLWCACLISKKKSLITIKYWDTLECPNMLSFTGRKLDPCDLPLERLIFLVRDHFQGFTGLLHLPHVFTCLLMPLKPLLLHKPLFSQIPPKSFLGGPSDLSLFPMYQDHATRDIWDKKVI